MFITPANQTGTSSATPKMQGFGQVGSQMAISGSLTARISGTAKCSGSSTVGLNIQLYCDKTAAPANGDSPTGTAIGVPVLLLFSDTSGTANFDVECPFYAPANATGLDVATYWVDVAISSVSGGVVSLENVTIELV